MVYRIYVEKKQGLTLEANALLSDIRSLLNIQSGENVRIINRYDAEKLPKENFDKAIPTVFSEPPVDEVFSELPALAADEPATDITVTEYFKETFGTQCYTCSHHK